MITSVQMLLTRGQVCAVVRMPKLRELGVTPGTVPPPRRRVPCPRPAPAARIKYILRQSDIFTMHFGVSLSDSDEDDDGDDHDSEGGSGPEDSGKGGQANGAGTGAGPSSPSKRRRPRGRRDEAPEADATNGEEPAPTYLMQQPPSISGGKLRSYQMEGLNWMINLQAQGTNGTLATRIAGVGGDQGRLALSDRKYRDACRSPPVARRRLARFFPCASWALG